MLNSMQTWFPGGIPALFLVLVAFVAGDHDTDGDLLTAQDRCAEACTQCQLECDACFAHCAALVREGHTDHSRSMHLSLDCAECCRICASLCARHSEFSEAAAEFCEGCCNECSASCESFPDDLQMAACAECCRKCSDACHDMERQTLIGRSE